MENITVHVVKYRDRKNLVMRYLCLFTNKQIQRTTGTNLRSKAEKVAVKWESELQEGRYQRDSRMPWSDFRQFWEDAKLPSLKHSTAMNYASTMNAFEAECRPKRISDLTTARVAAFASAMREKRLREATIAKHLRSLKAMARWAHRSGLLTTIPQFDMPRAVDAARMKGRPITGEEFERMLSACDGVVGEHGAESWRLLLQGLWTSGLRLGEALSLRWDHTHDGVSVALDGPRSVLLFDGASQKSGKAEAVALAPEAAQMLEPHKRKSGPVFLLTGPDGKPASRRVLAVGRRIARIGKAAGVMTDPEIRRTATAHDLRRAFGYRWSRRVMPATLKSLMRHASIETTMTYYVGDDAKAVAAELWAAVKTGGGTKSGTNRPQCASSHASENEQTPANAEVC